MTDSSFHSLLSGVEKTVGKALLSRIQSARILVVGSGGIGCELLKNLALSGFLHVDVIDLDTVDVSNLNRQFLFRSEHVGLPKCEVACAAALRMVPECSSGNIGKQRTAEYSPHHGNVCDNSKFNVQYISTFDLVLNALDNVVARRRVNRLCLAASVPLVEAGTTGYLGQVTVIDKASNVECYECQPKPMQKVYPICTIRSTPSMPVHTIVWAKELYKLLFGPKVEESMLFEDQNNGSERSSYMDLVMELRILILEKGPVQEALIREKAAQTLTALYETEIIKQLSMKRYTTAQKIPLPLSKEVITKGALGTSGLVAPTKRTSYRQTQVWNVEDCISEATACLIDAAVMSSSRDGKHVILPEFDKDDVLSMRFVTATSNLRSYVFDIVPIQSFYDAKGIAGNIIPAIATTNAIVAGLQVLQVFQILKKQMDGKEKELAEVCRYIYCLRDKTRRGYYLQPTKLPEPNPECFVCREAVLILSLDTTKWTLKSLLRRIVKKELGFVEPSIMIDDSIIYEEGEGLDESDYAVNLEKTLVNLPAGGVVHGAVIRIEDFTQDLNVDVCVSHKEKWNEEDTENGMEEDDQEEQFSIGGDRPTSNNKEANGDVKVDTTVPPDDNGDKDSEDDDIEIVSDVSHFKNTLDIDRNGDSKKRGALDEIDYYADSAKRARISNNTPLENGNGIEVVEIE